MAKDKKYTPSWLRPLSPIAKQIYWYVEQQTGTRLDRNKLIEVLKQFSIIKRNNERLYNKTYYPLIFDDKGSVVWAKQTKYRGQALRNRIRIADKLYKDGQLSKQKRDQIDNQA